MPWTITGREALVRSMNVKFALFHIERIPARWNGDRWETEHRSLTRVSDWVHPATDKVVFTVPDDMNESSEVSIGMFGVDDDQPMHWVDALGSVIPGMSVSLRLSDLVTAR